MLPGVSGTLFPTRYVADRLLTDARALGRPAGALDPRRLTLWWRRVESTCGPATGVRTLFDVAAMPLAALLGYRASRVEFAGSHALVTSETPGRTILPLIVAKWAERSPGVWRDAVGFARRLDSAWCLVLAPPYLIVVDAGAAWSRRAIEFRFPALLDTPDGPATLAAAAAPDAFERARGDLAPLRQLVAAGALFQDRVREDLQAGVHAALGALAQVSAGGARSHGRLGFDEALTIVYRVLFLLFVESRDMVPWQHPMYRAYSMTTLCRSALDTAGLGARGLAWPQSTRLLRRGCRVDDLIVRPFNGRLFARAAAPSLEGRGEAAGATTPERRRGRRPLARARVVVHSARSGRA